MSINDNLPARRKPFYHRVTADYRYDASNNEGNSEGNSEGNGGSKSGWRQWLETENGVTLSPHQGLLELKDHNVEALPIDESKGSFGGL
ncbi:MAG: hypothetical protein HRT35_38880, partial [Algicola sp.]|nr:hypothetical protein [Algicola sp.]